MEQIPLAATRRQGVGKGAARRLRAEGEVPAVIYGAGKEADNLSVAVRDLEKVLRQVTGSIAFLALKVDEESPRTAILQQLQADPLGRNFLHVDFYEVKPDQKLTLDVSLVYVGDAKGAAEGGVLSISAHTLTVQGTVGDIPDSIEVDVSELAIDDAIYLRELTMPAGVAAVADDDLMLVAVNPPALPEELEEEEVEGEEGEEGAEPTEEAKAEEAE